MAYMTQENKKSMAPALKAVFKKYGLKASLAVEHMSTFVVNIKSGPFDFIAQHNRMFPEYKGDVRTYLDVNPYHFKKHFEGDALACMTEIHDIMNNGNHDNSDVQSDYFDVGWYIRVSVGRWNKPYILVEK